MAQTISLASWIVAAASVGTMVAAFAGLALAFRQVRVSREVSAQDAYESYHHLGLQYPKLAFGTADVNKMSPSARDQYCWFVLSMLLTVERIVLLFPNDKEWRVAVSEDIASHSSLIGSLHFRNHLESLDPRVRALIDEVIGPGIGRELDPD